jgi:very-short-patch-repair endonuclease
MTRLTEHARRLRSNSTDAERLLWTRRRAARLNGHKFKRQQPVGAYIVDFVCFEAKVVLELDGGQHAEAAAEDRARDAWLRAQGFTVLRFWNNDVLQNLDGVLERIVENLPPLPGPLPRGEREMMVGDLRNAASW